MAHTWGTLLEYVRTGQPAYQKVFGRPFWEDLAAHPNIAADFDALMGPAGHGMPDFDIELAGGWDAIRTMVDVGGGTGAMLASLLRRHPHVNGILVDLPGTIARAGDLLTDTGVAERITLHGQSFFDPLPAGADLYLLKNVLNDWPDQETVAILSNCAQAAKATGSIAVLGGVARRRRPAVPGHRHAGRGREDQYDRPVHRTSQASRARHRRRAHPSLGPLRRRMPAKNKRKSSGRANTMTEEAARARRLVHGQVCYLQMPAIDAARAAAFYEAVFGWQTEHPYQDFESPGLIGQWVPGRPPPRRRPDDLDPRRRPGPDARSSHQERRRDHGPPVPRRTAPHPGHHRRPRRQPHRPGQPHRQLANDLAPGGTPPGKQPSQFSVEL